MASPYDLREPLEADRTQKFMSTDTVRAPGPREIAADRGYGGKLKMAADLFPQIVEASDGIIKKDISQSLNDATDQVNAEYGIDGRLFGQDVTDPDPINRAEMERMSETISNINAGYKAGRIADSHYWARLDSIARQMRARYPGHRDFIDDKIASIVGSKPANRLREEMAAEARAKSSEKDPFEKGVDGAVENSLRDGTALMVDPDIFNKMANGTANKYDLARKLNAYNGRTEQIKRQEAEIALSRNLDQDSSVKSMDTFLIKMDNKFDTSVGPTVGPMIANYQKFTSTLDTINSQTGPITAEQKTELTKSWNAYRLQFQQQMEVEMTKKQEGGWTYREVLQPTEEDAVYKRMNDKFAFVENILTNPTTGALNGLKNYLEDKQTQTAVNLSEDPDYLFLNTISKNLSPDIVNHVYMTSGIMPKFLQKSKEGFYYDLITGRRPSVDAAMNNSVKAIENDPVMDDGEKKKQIVSIARDQVKTVTQIITDPATAEDARLKMIMATFGPENEDFLRNFKDPDLKREMYFQLTSAGVADDMWKRGQQDARIWDAYSKWTKKNFFNLFKTHANELNNTMIHRKYADLSFDEKKLRFDLETRSYGQGKSTPTSAVYKTLKVLTGVQSAEEGSELLLQSNAETAVRTMNTAIQGLEGVIRHEGGDVNKQILKAVAEIGFNNDQKYQGSVIDQMYMSLGQMIRKQIEKSKGVEIDPETQKILDGEQEVPPDQNKIYQLVE